MMGSDCTNCLPKKHDTFLMSINDNFLKCMIFFLPKITFFVLAISQTCAFTGHKGGYGGGGGGGGK